MKGQATMKQKFYRIDRILKTDAQYNIILGERSNGKSYAVKHYCIKEAIEDKNKKFIYLRRWDLEIKQNLTQQYFADVNIEALTDGRSNCIIVYRGNIYTGFLSEDGKTERQEHIGYCRAISMEQHYTSGNYNDVSNIIFEEFVSRQQYLPKEPMKLMQFVSTVVRRRDNVKVWMIGNTISRVCPYFSEWELKNIPKQKQGTIDIYNHGTDQETENGEKLVIKIAVEYAENSGKNSTMFFGNIAKSITSGLWQSDAKPHLPKKLHEYICMYDVVIQLCGFSFLARFLLDETGASFWYVEPKTKTIKPNTRLVTDQFIPDNSFATYGFRALSPNEKIAFDSLKNGMVCFSDNLTGSEFEQCMKMFLTLAR